MGSPLYSEGSCQLEEGWDRPRQIIRRNESGHQQMLRQAAAVLVPFPTLFAAQLDPVAFAAVFEQGLPVASPPGAGLLQGSLDLIQGQLFIINGAGVWCLRLDSRRELGPLGRQARRWRARTRGLGNGPPPRNYRTGRKAAVLLQGSYNGLPVGCRACQALAAGDAVGSIERRAGGGGMRAVAGVRVRMGLAALKGGL